MLIKMYVEIDTFERDLIAEIQKLREEWEEDPRKELRDAMRHIEETLGQRIGRKLIDIL